MKTVMNNFCICLAKVFFDVLCLLMLIFVLQMSHAAATALCRSQKLQCELYPSRDVALCLDPYCGLGFVLWCLSRLVLGHLFSKSFNRTFIGLLPFILNLCFLSPIF